LVAIVADRNRPQKHAARVRIILHSAERLDVAKSHPSSPSTAALSSPLISARLGSSAPKISSLL